MVKNIIRKIPIRGPMYGIKFKRAHKKAITNAFSILNTVKTIV